MTAGCVCEIPEVQKSPLPDGTDSCGKCGAYIFRSMGKTVFTAAGPAAPTVEQRKMSKRRTNLNNLLSRINVTGKVRIHKAPTKGQRGAFASGRSKSIPEGYGKSV